MYVHCQHPEDYPQSFAEIHSFQHDLGVWHQSDHVTRWWVWPHERRPLHLQDSTGKETRPSTELHAWIKLSASLSIASCHSNRWSTRLLFPKKIQIKHTHTHTYTHTHAHTHYAHTCTHTHACTHACTYTHTHAHTHMHAHT